jgi:glyoxylase-like metal-dependent hydrolase (beta-lactamase superfamily II)
LGASIKEVSEGVFRLTTSEADQFGEVVSRVHSFLVELSSGRYILVDSGWARSSGDLIGVLRDEFGDGIAIERILLTHLHPDHYGAAKAIAKNYSAKVSYHRRETLHLGSYYDVLNKGMTAAADWLGFPPDVLHTVQVAIAASRENLPALNSYLLSGESIKARSGAWHVVHTPGHSPGHVCLHRPNDGTLISGDHILPGETPNVAYYPIPGYSALGSYLASLAKVKRLAPSAALPGHGNVIKDVAKRIDAISVHHEDRLREVLGSLRDGEHSIVEVTSSVKWSRGPYESLGQVNKWLAILETIAHLEFLVECGVVRRVRGPRRKYRLTGGNWSPVEKAVGRILSSGEPSQVAHSAP